MPEPMDPIKIFAKWFTEAKEKETAYPNAMALSTVAADGMPDVRIVLLKKFDEFGFSFFTNYESKKAKDLNFNPKAAICFYWKSLEKQVRISGHVTKLPDSESDEYFETRPRASQIGAWASRQSFPMTDDHDLDASVIIYEQRFNLLKVPRPLNWGGYILKPVQIEFWEERPSRLHRRKCFSKSGETWRGETLYP